MPQLSPTVFGLIVIAVVGSMVLVPRIRARSKRPTQHDMYFGDAAQGPSRPTQSEAPLGAPRAAAPTRQAPGQPPQPETPAPLKLPF